MIRQHTQTTTTTTSTFNIVSTNNTPNRKRKWIQNKNGNGNKQTDTNTNQHTYTPTCIPSKNKNRTWKLWMETCNASKINNKKCQMAKWHQITITLSWMPYGVYIWNGITCGTLRITHLPLVDGWYLADSECGWTFRKFKIHDPKIELLNKTSCSRRCWDLTYNIIFTKRNYFGCQRKSCISKTNKGKSFENNFWKSF